MSAMEIAIIIVVALVVIALIVGAAYLWRHRSLEHRYGEEYRRLVASEGRLAADRTLRERERRHRQLELRDLDPATRERYRAAWSEIQTRFVDAPEAAIDEAQELITSLAAEKGYPTDDQIEQLSVDHGRTLDKYRYAQDLHRRHQQGEASTEELRDALVHYRALFADMLGEQPVRGTPS